MLIRTARNRGDIGDAGLAVFGVLILIAVLYFLSRIGLPSVPKDAQGQYDLSGHPDLSNIYLRYDDVKYQGVYVDDLYGDHGKILTDPEVRERIANPPGTFERHSRISEFIAVFLIIMAAAGSGGTVILTMSYGASGGFTGYSRTYVPGGSGGGVNPAGCGLIFVIVFLLVGYYWHFSSPGVARGWGAIIDLCLRLLWWCCKFCQGDI